MSDPDRLPEIKAQLANVDRNERVRSLGPNLTRVYLDWLIGEVEQLRNQVRIRELECNRAERERDDLRQREHLRGLASMQAAPPASSDRDGAPADYDG